MSTLISDLTSALHQEQARRLREAAEKLTPQIEHLRRPLSQNGTPKRIREFNSRVHDGNNLERVQNAMLGLAEAHESGTCPPELVKLKSKAEIHELVRCRLDTTGGYYSANPTDEYMNTSEIAKKLQELMGAQGRGKDPAVALRLQIDKLENELRFSNIPGFFPTPKQLAEKLVALAHIPLIGQAVGQMKCSVLEPSAGKGDIAEVIVDWHGPDVELEVCEINQRLQDILGLKGFNVVGDDFLDLEFKRQYDRIIMNPPFENGQDVKHVLHAYTRLNPGGKLVSIVSTGAFFREDRQARDFRNWLETCEHEVEDVEAGAFSGVQAFRQTGVACKILSIEKPRP